MRYYDLDTNGKVKGSYAVPQPDKELTLLQSAPDDESMWDGSQWIPDPDIVNARLAEEARIAARVKDITGNLPSLAEIEAAIDGVSTIAGLKVVVKKIARVVYWLAKDKAD